MKVGTSRADRPDAGASSVTAAKTFLFWMAMILLAVLLWKMSSVKSPPPRTSLNDSQFQAQLDKKNIRSVHATVYQTRTLFIFERRDSEERFQAYVSNDHLPKIIHDLQDSGADVWVEGGREQDNDWVSILLDAVPFIILLFVFLVILRRTRMSKARDLGPGQPQ
ncbi:MAG TPA: ATP-dependent metallopeptidase FtsH/Yme1/Tma family protein [Candidatus Acidoferrales bacterium]|nr:ATP-dependent metallopeptidase FtsH/Yme1/Tma family protein [Candidatus Acidoferrales bacterium]